MKRLLATAALASALHFAGVGLAAAQYQYLGEVRLFAFALPGGPCPNGWAQAAGQTLSISQYTALFALIGTTYGGNGTSNFQLPNLQGRAPYGYTPAQPLGLVYGSSTVTLTVQNLPAHSHSLNASSAAPTAYNPSGALDATFPSTEKVFAAPGSPANVPMAATTIGITGSNVPVTTQSPALNMNWCIATTGIFPTPP